MSEDKTEIDEQEEALEEDLSVWQNEPEVIINGRKLNLGQAMTLRVALGSFAISLQGGLGSDETGKELAKGYRRAVDSINDIIHNSVPEKKHV